VPGGREVKVTEANKHEYVNLIARHRMTTSIKAQIQVRRQLGGVSAIHPWMCLQLISLFCVLGLPILCCLNCVALLLLPGLCC
jgi:hypothetical protein